MVRKLLLAAAVICVSMLLGSCNGFDPVAENLMRPPSLTAEQKAIETALKRAAISEPILKYPKGGNYRSAFVFQDIDDDGVEEALAFYATADNNHTRVALLDLDAHGEWYSPCELPGLDVDVEFVEFAHVSSPITTDIVIGWSNPDDDTGTMGVYTYLTDPTSNEPNRAPTLQSQLGYSQEDVSFSSYLIDDLDKDGLDDIFLLTTKGRTSHVKQISYTGYGVGIMSEYPLSSNISSFANVTAGKLTQGSSRRGLFIDEVLSDGIVTEVFSIKHGELYPIIWHDMENSDSEDSKDFEETADAEVLPTLYEQTYRPNTSTDEEGPAFPICTDINSDTIIEIPTARPMPGYQDGEETERIYLTEYHRLQDDKLERVFAAAFNRSAGYRVKFPDEWIDNVTVVNQIENGEWRFIVYNPALKRPLEDLSGELARVRVVSQVGFMDKFLESYFPIGAPRGLFTYYGYVPENTGRPLEITDELLREELFSLL